MSRLLLLVLLPAGSGSERLISDRACCAGLDTWCMVDEGRGRWGSWQDATPGGAEDVGFL